MAKSGIAVPDDENKRAEVQFQFAWQHFNFHAEQRTKMFHFFLIVAGGILGAWGLITEQHRPDLTVAGILIPAFGAIFSTLFLVLDIRNTQLLEMSENLLRKMEEAWIYKGTAWRRQTKYGDVMLGLLSREALLKCHMRNKLPYGWLTRLILVNNIKHKTSVRAILLISILGFWILAGWASWTANMLQFWVIVVAILSAIWSGWALFSPYWHLKCEAAAWAGQRGTPNKPRLSTSPRSRKSSSSRALRGKK